MIDHNYSLDDCAELIKDHGMTFRLQVLSSGKYRFGIYKRGGCFAVGLKKTPRSAMLEAMNSIEWDNLAKETEE